MTAAVNPEAAMRMATDIVIAYLGNRTVDPEALPSLVRDVRLALVDERAARSFEPTEPPLHEAQSAVSLTPPVPIEESVAPDFLICLEDGQKFRSLKRHLALKHGMTPEEYRRKWELPPDYPMVAPRYAEERSAVAKRSGLGRHPDRGRKSTKS